MLQVILAVVCFFFGLCFLVWSVPIIDRYLFFVFLGEASGRLWAVGLEAHLEGMYHLFHFSLQWCKNKNKTWLFVRETGWSLQYY